MPEGTNTANATALLRPEEVGPLLIQPIDAQSIAAQVATVVATESHEYRLPVVTADPSAGWVAEGADIDVSDLGTDEVVVTPAKLAGITVVSRELADDSTPEASKTVGDALVRDIVRKLDQAFFGSLPSPAPKGLASLVAGGRLAVVNREAGDQTLDAFAEAISEAELVGATVDHFVANPADALALATIKDEAGSNRPLLGTDAASRTKRQLQGVPLLVSPYVAPGIVWGIPKSRTFIIRRTNARVESSEHSHFGSDQIAIRATTRHGFGFPHPESIVLVNLLSA